jgi:F-type H+-transporting ATPase subunit b
MRRAFVTSGLAALIVSILVVPRLYAAEKEHKDHDPTYDLTYLENGKEVEKTLDLRKPEDKQFFEKIMAEAEHGHIEQLKLSKAPNLFEIQWDLALWTIVVFALTLLILSKVAWGPMLEGLRNRESNIRKALDDAHAAREDAQKLQNELAAERATAAQHVQQMFDEARKKADQAAEELIAKARAEITADRERLHRELETEKAQTRNELINFSVSLATLISARVLHRQMNENDHRQVADEALDELNRYLGDGERRA